MAPKKTLYVGTNHIAPKPSNQVSTTTHYSSSSGTKGRATTTDSTTQLHTATKSIFKSDKGKASTSFKKSVCADEFVDKSTGRLGFKEEATYARTDKYNNKNEGYTHEYETQVKFKHVAYPKPPASAAKPNKQITYNDYYYY